MNPSMIWVGAIALAAAYYMFSNRKPAAGGTLPGFPAVATAVVSAPVIPQLLDGGQIASIVDLLQRAHAGQVPRGSVRPLLLALLPGLEEKLLGAIAASLEPDPPKAQP